MTAGKAVAVFVNIESEEFTTDEKLEAINYVLKMPTYNSITKVSFRNALNWLWNNVLDWAEGSGAWIYGEYDIPHCSECGHTLASRADVSPYCPNCGTLMEVENEQDED